MYLSVDMPNNPVNLLFMYICCAFVDLEHLIW